MSLGAIIGPTATGWVFDTYNDYQSAWIAFAVVCIITMVIVATAPPARPKTTVVSSNPPLRPFK